MISEQVLRLELDTAAASAGAARLFDATAPRLRLLLPVPAGIRHIGATAIPGCVTKGDLDIVVRVKQADFAAADAALASAFARNEGSERSESFSAFEDGAATPHLGIQLTAIGGPVDVFHTFAEALAGEPALLVEYNALKRDFDGMPMDEYRAAKSRFVERVLAAIVDAEGRCG